MNFYLHIFLFQSCLNDLVHIKNLIKDYCVLRSIHIDFKEKHHSCASIEFYFEANWDVMEDLCCFLEDLPQIEQIETGWNPSRQFPRLNREAGSRFMKWNED